MMNQRARDPVGRREMSRRHLLAAVGTTAAGTVLFGAAGGRATAAARAAGTLAAVPFVAYHGVTGAVHQQRFDELAPQGYRMISLSVFDSTPLYAAVWVQRAGPAWAAVHGLSAVDYQSRFNELTGQGFVPVLVSATGSRAAPIFAAVFERLSPAVWQARHGLVDGPAETPGTLAGVNQWAQNNNCIPRSVAVYGSGAGDRTYAGVWLPNPGAIRWQHGPTGDGAEHRAWFDAYRQVPMRPAFVDANDGVHHAALFTDDSVGAGVARHGMTGADYQAEFNTQAGLGRMPVYVQGGGTGAGVRYAALFAAQDQPVARQWTQTNAAGASRTGVHAVFRSFMEANGVRAGVLSVRRNRSSVLSSGYTWAEPGYPITQPGSLFRLASVSKAFTSAAIRTLVAAKKLTLDTAVFPLLGISSVALPDQTKDANIDAVTVQHCIDHAGGWDAGAAGFDAVFEGRSMARRLNLSGHVTKRDVARYVYGQPLQFIPGARSVYANVGYVLLSLVVEKVSGQSFQNYLQQQVLSPLGVANQVWTGATLRSGRRGSEVSYDAPYVGDSAWDPLSNTRVAGCYGTFLIAEMDGGGGLVATAPAVTALIGRHAVSGLGGRAAGEARNGIMAGTMSLAKSRSDGIDWCFIVNSRQDVALRQLSDDLDNAIGAAGF
jgi:CubicO group peptidase (beta-lactamase class C family)